MTRPAPDSGRNRATGSRNGFSLLLNSGLDAAYAARQAVIASDGGLPASARADVLLVVTELVTNAVRHAGVRAGQSLRVELQLLSRCVRVEVLDAGAGFARPSAPFPKEDSGGWGLFLVDQVADRWGIDRAASGTRVWCEIGLDA